MKGKLSLTRAAAVGLAVIIGTGPALATVHNIDVGNYYFSPANTWVVPGDTVTWTLVDGMHTTTSDTSSPKQWDSDTLEIPGQTFSVVFEAEDGIGPFPYHCEFHSGSMQDTIFQDLPPEFQSVASECVEVGQSVYFDLISTDPNGLVPFLTAVNLPAGTIFIDNSDGTGSFNWPSGPSQAGIYTPTFIAHDGTLADTMPVPIIVGGCNGGDPQFSTTDPFLILSLSGNISFHVTVTDDGGAPVESSYNAWLDFSGVTGLTACPSESSWPLVFPTEPSDVSGMLSISAQAGGCSTDSVKVMSSHGEIGRVPIKSLDHNGGMLVTAGDFVGDECNDYDNDGDITTADWDFFEPFLEDDCVDGPADYIQPTLFTIPDPSAIYVGDTIQICGRVVNLLNETANLDSVVFTAANWGIAQPWAGVNELYDVNLPPLDTIDLCVDFVVPDVNHGCFHISVWPTFVKRLSLITEEADIDALTVRLASSSEEEESTDDLNVDTEDDCGYDPDPGTDDDGDGIINDDDLCPGTPPCCDIYTIDAAKGCGQPGTNPDGDACEQIPPSPKASVTRKKVESRSTWSGAAATYQTYIPVGTEFGDSLQLYVTAFLPSEWSYATSDTGWIQTPGTLFVEVSYDSIPKCYDSARLIFYAYNADEQYAGQAEVLVHGAGTRGDIDNEGGINIADLTFLVDYLFRGGLEPTHLESADVNNDQGVNVADLTYLVDYLFRGGPPPPC